MSETGSRHPSWGRADEVLELLRKNTDEALWEAEKILGRRITQCPPAVPPWPPKPVHRDKVLRVVRIDATKPFRGQGTAHRFSLVRVGMSREKLLSRGVLVRDLRVWQRSGAIVMEER